MAEREKDEKPDAEEKSEKPKAASWRSRFRQPLWVCMLLGTTVVAHGLLITSHALFGSASEHARGEVSLGRFAYVNDRDTHDSLGKVGFDLHIRLLDRVDKTARRQLHDREHRVRQDVEELLRRAHGADFEDPSLSELKRQLQETVNQSLELRAVDEVIITDLTIDIRQTAPRPDVTGQQSAVAINLGAKPAG